MTLGLASDAFAEQKKYIDHSNVLKITVEKGDTLSDIAANLDHSWEWLYSQTKNEVGNNPHKIFPGQEMNITLGYVPHSNLTVNYIDHSDTLESIAKARGVDRNWLENNNYFPEGMDPNNLPIGKMVVTNWNLKPPKYQKQ